MKAKKRILFSIPTNSAGGAERVLTSIANYAAEQGYEVDIVNFDSDSHFYPIDARVNILKLGVNFNINSKLGKILLAPYIETKRFILAYKTIKKYKPDVVVAFLKTAEIIFGTCALLLNIPLVVSIRNDYYNIKGVLKKFRKIAYPKASLVVCQSNQVIQKLQSEISCNAIVLPNPISSDAISENNYLGKTRENKIVSVGRLCVQKNFVLLIEAMRKVYEWRPDLVNFRTEIYGDGELRESLQRLIDSYNLQHIISLKGIVKNALAQNNNASLYVMASDYEGFPNALVEAMANGIPAISTDFSTGVASDLIGDNERGRIIPIGDVIELAKAIEWMLSHREDAEELALKAYKNVQQFSRNKVCERWLEEIIKTI